VHGFGRLGKGLAIKELIGVRKDHRVCQSVEEDPCFNTIQARISDGETDARLCGVDFKIGVDGDIFICWSPVALLLISYNKSLSPGQPLICRTVLVWLF